MQKTILKLLDNSSQWPSVSTRRSKVLARQKSLTCQSTRSFQRAKILKLSASLLTPNTRTHFKIWPLLLVWQATIVAKDKSLLKRMASFKLSSHTSEIIIPIKLNSKSRHPMSPTQKSLGMWSSEASLDHHICMLRFPWTTRLTLEDLKHLWHIKAMYSIVRISCLSNRKTQWSTSARWPLKSHQISSHLSPTQLG